MTPTYAPTPGFTIQIHLTAYGWIGVVRVQHSINQQGMGTSFYPTTEGVVRQLRQMGFVL